MQVVVLEGQVLSGALDAVNSDESDHIKDLQEQGFDKARDVYIAFWDEDNLLYTVGSQLL